MAPKYRNGTTVRFRKGRTVDTEHVSGGDLSGLHATVASEPFEANGSDGPKGQMRVALAVNDDRAPRGAGLITAPVENIEPGTRWGRLKAAVSGFGPGHWSKPGEDPIQLRRARERETSSA